MTYLDDLLNMTPKERVFGTMKNLLIMITDSPDLEAEREQLKDSLANAISWEPELIDRVHTDST